MPKEDERYLDIKTIRIPRKRMPEIKKFREDLEEIGNVKIEINEEISVSGCPICVFEAMTVIKAIGRGFSFEDARLIFDGHVLYVIDIAKDRKMLRRIRSRVIGTKGKIKRKIEEITSTRISVYGKTVSIIGKDEDLENSRLAIEKIIEGKSHSAVFKFLEAKNKG